MKLPLFFTLLYGTAVSAAYVIDEIVPGKAEMVSADRVHGHEWAVFWRLVDTELSFDLTINPAFGWSATGKILFKKGYLEDIQLLSGEFVVAETSTKDNLLQSLQVRNLLNGNQLRTVRGSWSQIGPKTRQAILGRQAYIAVELLNPDDEIAYARGQLVPGNIAGGSNNDGSIVDVDIVTGISVERTVSATGWVQSFASSAGTDVSFSLKYCAVLDQGSSVVNEQKNGIASLGIAMAPHKTTSEETAADNSHSAIPKLELREVDRLPVQHGIKGSLKSRVSGMKQTTNTTMMLLHRPNIIPSPRLQVQVGYNESVYTVVGVPIRDLTMPIPVQRGIALLKTEDSDNSLPNTITISGLLYVELDADGRKLDWLLLSMHPQHVRPHVDYGLDQDPASPWFQTTRSSQPLSDTNYVQSGYWTAVPPRAPGATMRVAVNGVHNAAVNTFSDADGTGSIVFGNFAYALCPGRGTEKQPNVMVTFEIVDGCSSSTTQQLKYTIAIAGSSSITSLELVLPTTPSNNADGGRARREEEGNSDSNGGETTESATPTTTTYLLTVTSITATTTTQMTTPYGSTGHQIPISQHCRDTLKSHQWCIMDGSLQIDPYALVGFATETTPGYSSALLYVGQERGRQQCRTSLLSTAALFSSQSTCSRERGTDTDNDNDNDNDNNGNNGSGLKIAGAVAMTVLLSISAFIFGGARESRKRRRDNRKQLTSDFSNPLADDKKNQHPDEDPHAVHHHASLHRPLRNLNNTDNREADGGSVVCQDVAEVWIQLTEDTTGDCYYYNKATEETKWEHPGANVIIIKELDL